MKKTLFTIGFLVLSGIGFSQIAITLDAETIDRSGDSILLNTTDESEHIFDLYIQNQSSMNQEWVITRKRINVVSPQWHDILCWGIEGDPFSTCYEFDEANPWTTGQSVVVAPNLKGLLAIHITPDFGASEFAHYRYYVGRTSVTPDDSVDIVFNQVASVGSENELSLFTANPNPCNDYLHLKFEDGKEVQLQIRTITGELVFEEKMQTAQKILTTSFPEGVYLLYLSTKEGVRSTKRILIKH